MSTRDIKAKSKDTYARRKMRARMVKNLQAGKRYGTDFWHPTKNDIKDAKHPSRYGKQK